MNIEEGDIGPVDPDAGCQAPAEPTEEQVDELFDELIKFIRDKGILSSDQHTLFPDMLVARSLACKPLKKALKIILIQDSYEKF